MITDKEAALNANIRDMDTGMREAFEHVSDAECANVLAALRRVKLTTALFVSAIDAERKALANVMTGHGYAPELMSVLVRELVGDMLALNGDAQAVLEGL